MKLMMWGEIIPDCLVMGLENVQPSVPILINIVALLSNVPRLSSGIPVHQIAAAV